MREPARTPVDQAAGLAACHREATDRPWSAETFATVLTAPGVAAWDIGDGTEIAAFLIVRSVLDETEILMIATRPAARRKGHARALLERALAALHEAGIATIHLEVDASNAAALSLYRDLGFAETGRRTGYYPTQDGRRSDAVVMARACLQPVDRTGEGVDAAAPRPHPLRKPRQSGAAGAFPGAAKRGARCR